MPLTLLGSCFFWLAVHVSSVSPNALVANVDSLVRVDIRR